MNNEKIEVRIVKAKDLMQGDRVVNVGIVERVSCTFSFVTVKMLNSNDWVLWRFDAKIIVQDKV